MIVTLATCGAVPVVGQDYEAFYLNNRRPYPVAETIWSNDVQGVAHDDNHWYITATTVFWKIPVEQDLRTVTLGSPGVVLRAFGHYPQLTGYDHFGDPDVYRFDGTDYLLLPIENHDGALQGAIAILRCADLSYVAHFALPNPPSPHVPQANDCGWVAVHSLGALFTSKQHVGPLPGLPPRGLRVYFLDWGLLHASGLVDVQFELEIPVYDEQGELVHLTTMQGGEFAPGDNLLYLVSGFYDDDDGLEEREGIHVFETVTYQRVAHSTRGYGHFDYYYDPGFPTYEEPEGLTIWDLDDGRAPGIRGQLHVLVSDNDADGGDVDFKHYTNIIRVAANGSCEYSACCSPFPPFGCPTPFNATCEFGIASCPFRTIGSALNLAWNGAEIRIGAATYPETMTISKRIRLTTNGGVARIGG
jgi:hypothetical protein